MNTRGAQITTAFAQLKELTNDVNEVLITEYEETKSLFCSTYSQKENSFFVLSFLGEASTFFAAFTGRVNPNQFRYVKNQFERTILEKSKILV